MRIYRLFTIALAVSFCLSTASIQAQAPQSPSGSTAEATQAGDTTVIDLSTLLAQSGKARRRGFTLGSESDTASAGGSASSITPLAAGPSLPATGSGTLGRLTKWTGFTGSNSAIGDTTIYEDKFGKVGIGTDSPTSRLTVAGVIESTGGFKFPDGSVRTSAGVIHDATLKGDGTAASPLAVAAPAGEPFQREVTVDTPSPGSTGTATILVPANKRLLIDFASIRVTGFSPTTPPSRMEITTSLGGESATYQLGPERTVLSGGINTHIASQQVVIWADPGTTVSMRVTFNVPGASFTTEFAVSGRLFDAP
ncbi:MAG TPA: hypothetical protein VFV34_16465 [Blastocatellia bacterium]|nr:hypothetical protein [Blastocatellia bacterium]